MKKVKEIYYHCSCGTELTVSANDKVIALRNYVCVNCGQMLVADVNYEEVKEESLEDKFFDRMSDAIMDLSLTSMDDLLKEAEKRCIAFVAAYQLNEDKERKNGFTTWNGKGAWSDNVFLSDVLHHEIINKMDKTDEPIYLRKTCDCGSIFDQEPPDDTGKVETKCDICRLNPQGGE